MEGVPNRSRLDRAYLFAFVGVAAIQLSAAIIQLITNTTVPGATVLASLFVVACMLRTHGPSGTLSFVGLVIAIPFASEFLGVLTGIPYGAYAYLEAPGPYVLGLVPVFIFIAWILVGYLAIATTTAVLGRSSLWLAPVDGLVATAWDLLVDPVAVRSQFWTWGLSPATLYGVPLSNFLGWFLIVTGLSVATRWMWARDVRAPVQMPRSILTIVPGVLLTSALQFGILATAYGFYVSTLIGLGIVIPVVGLAWRRLATMPRELFAPNLWTPAPAAANARRIAQEDDRA